MSVSELEDEAADSASERIELAHWRGRSAGMRGRALVGGTRRRGSEDELVPGVVFDEGL